jgi:hypothetical protein
MSYTTNDATKRLPTTYSDRRVECEHLLKIAREMEPIAFSNDNFLYELRFRELEIEFQSRFRSLLSLTTI